MSIFGNFGANQSTATSGTAPQTGGGLFGATNNQQQQQPAAGGLFGSLNTQNQQPNQPTSSIFGNPLNTNTSGGGLFGGGQSTNTNTNQGGGLFGGTQPQQPATGGGLFGTSNAQQQPAAGGGLFGSSNTQQQQPAAGGGLFGSSNTQQQQPAAGGGLFGAANTQQQQPATGGGLFGASNTQQQQPQAGGGLFGGASGQQQQQQPATAGGGLFGQPSTAGGLFGGNTTSQPPQQQQQGSSLFGNNTPQQPQQQSGGLFGNSNATSGGGIFGNKPGLFGTSLNINTNTTAATSPSTTTANTNSLFGGSLAQPQQQQSSGLFGQPTQNQQQPQRPSLFGGLGQSTSNPNPLFGSSNNNHLNTSVLGTSALGGGGLGASTLTSNNLLASRSQAGPVQQQADAQAQQTKLLQRIEAIYSAWNATSPQCRFQYTFYNLVNPNQVSLYRQPPNIPNETWEKATRDNPDPTCFVPVIAFGFDDLRERVEAQSKQAEEHKVRLRDLKANLDALAERHSVSNAPRLQRAAAQQIRLTQRLLAFIQHLHLLIPAVRSSSIRPEEEQLRGKLEEIEEDLRRGRIKGKLNELWALIGAVNAGKERGRNASNGGEWAVVDDEGLGQITQILSEQQTGLTHLTKILQKALKDLNTIMGSGPGISHGDDSYMNDSDSVRGSTNTLRISSLR